MADGTIAQAANRAHRIPLTADWGCSETVSLYLDRCQVDTPDALVAATWKHVAELRQQIDKVVDFGAGDGRFAQAGSYGEYIGYEIDPTRWRSNNLPSNAVILNQCAFEARIDDADVCVGNPPFVRNQDLPERWRETASAEVCRRTGVQPSGLANAWQYFFLLSLASVKADGLCALVVPYEWVSRPSARALREYIRQNSWSVSVYRLVDKTFSSVLTTASITVVDKARRNETWSFYEECADGTFVQLPSASGDAGGVLPYLRRRDVEATKPRAVRGLSPGTQKVLTLTEAERARCGLKIGIDVVPCVTTLRLVPSQLRKLDESAHRVHFRDAGLKAWLIRTDRAPSERLAAYLAAVPEKERDTATCRERGEWWKFKMPPVPDFLVAQCFKASYPKAVENALGVRAVGGVCGIYGVASEQADQLIDGLAALDLRDRVVAHAKGLRKIEINQLNALLQDQIFAADLAGD